MAYATQIDLEQNYGADKVARLADYDRDGSPDPDAIEEALASASSIIDAYISVRYSVPLSIVTVVVRDLCVDIALYRLAHDDLKRTLEMRQRYDDAIALLIRIADGKASIGLDTDGDGESEVGGAFAATTRFLGRG